MAAPMLFFADLVRETSVATGTGPLQLAGALPGHRAFAGTVPVATLFHYTIAGVTLPGEWETGTGQISADGQIERTLVAASSAGGTAVDFSDGLKTVALTAGAGWFAAVSQPPMIAEVVGLNAALAGKQAAGSYAVTGHGHAQADIAGLTAALNAKQPVSTEHPVQPVLQASDMVTVRRGAGWVNVPGTAIVRPLANGNVGIATMAPEAALDVRGQIIGGFGAVQTGGVLDWNHVTNCRAGSGFTLLHGEAANGPGGSYAHPFNFEYESKDGTGNLTQFAVPYFGMSDFFGMRHRFGGTWSNWRAILTECDAGILPSADNSRALGSGARRFSVVYAASGTISTSDARTKRSIGTIPDSWLDAWDDVTWCRFKMRDGDRWHVGLVAQQVRDAFANAGIDACAIGLLCHDVWDGADGASKDDRWGLRYDECQAIEAAWQRRELMRLRASIAA